MRTLLTRWLFLCLFTIPTLSMAQTGAGSYRIVGVLKGLGNGKVLLGNKPNGISAGFKPEYYDSCIAREDTFTFAGQLAEAGIYSIEAPGKKGWCWFMLVQDTVRINGHSDSIWKARVTGSVDRDIYIQYQRTVALGKTRKLLDSLDLAVSSAGSQPDSLQLLKKKDSVYRQLNSERMRFLSDHPTSFATLYELSQLTELPIDSARSLFKALSPTLQAHSRGVKLRHRLFELDRSLAIGSPAPVFTLPDANGSQRKISTYRGKYVLLDFWASWCGPCIEELPTIKKLHAQYQTRGLQVVGISLDHQKDKWLAAMKKHDIRWPSWSDLKGTENEVASLYGIQAIPFKALIDPAGNLVLKNPSMEELETYLKAKL